MISDWPRWLVPRRVAADPVYAIQRGPRTLTGVEQRAASDAGYWRITYEGLKLTPRTLVLARALRARAEGGFGRLRIPVWDAGHQARTGQATIKIETGHGDGTEHSDGEGYAQGVSAGVTVAAAAALRATALDVAVPAGLRLEAGMHVSLVHRLHVVKASEDLVGGVQRLTLWPPLRRAAAVGDDLELDEPTCTVRLTGDDSFGMALDGLRFSEVSVTFEEAV